MNLRKSAGIMSLIMACSLCACGTKQTNVGSTGQGQSQKVQGEGSVEITLPTYMAGENVGGVFFLPQVERFNQKYEGKYKINVEAVPQSAYAEKIKLLAQQKKLPVIVHAPGSGGIDDQWFRQVVLPGHMAYDLWGFGAEYPEAAANWIKDSQEYCTVDGKLICKPGTIIKPIGLFYNEMLYHPEKEIRNQTMDELTAGLGDNKIAFQTADNGWTTGLLLTALIANEKGGLELLSDSADGKLWNYNQLPIINAVKKLKVMMQDYGAANTMGAAYADAANTFMSAQAAIICNGSWMASEFSPEAADKWSGDFTGAQVKASVYPGNIALARTRGYGQFWISSQATEGEIELAKAFFAFIDSKEEIEALLLAEGGDAPNVEYSENYLEEQKKSRVLYELSQSIDEETRYAVSIFDVMPNSVADVEFGKLLPKLVDGTFSAEQFCQELTRKAAEAKQ